MKLSLQTCSSGIVETRIGPDLEKVEQFIFKKFDFNWKTNLLIIMPSHGNLFDLVCWFVIRLAATKKYWATPVWSHVHATNQKCTSVELYTTTLIVCRWYELVNKHSNKSSRVHSTRSIQHGLKQNRYEFGRILWIRAPTITAKRGRTPVCKCSLCSQTTD